MTENEEVIYVSLAMKIVDANYDHKRAVFFVRIYELLKIYESKTTIEQIVAIWEQVNYEYEKGTLKP